MKALIQSVHPRPQLPCTCTNSRNRHISISVEHSVLKSTPPALTHVLHDAMDQDCQNQLSHEHMYMSIYVLLVLGPNHARSKCHAFNISMFDPII